MCNFTILLFLTANPNQSFLQIFFQLERIYQRLTERLKNLHFAFCTEVLWREWSVYQQIPVCPSHLCSCGFGIL